MHEIGWPVKLFRSTGLLIIALLFEGCSGTQQAGTATADAAGSSTSTTGSTTSTTGSRPSTTPATAAIALQGTPPATVTVGTDYVFQPVASPSNAGIIFTATGLPAWLSVNANTGALSGMPAAKDEGTTGHITITAGNGSSSASLTPFTIQVKGAAPSATEAVRLSWAAPTKNADGTPVTDLAGYHIYYGASSSEVTKRIDVAGAASTTYVIEGLTSGTYHFSLVAYNSAGLDSGQSNVADQTI
jgi:hypothetical protein